MGEKRAKTVEEGGWYSEPKIIQMTIVHGRSTAANDIGDAEDEYIADDHLRSFRNVWWPIFLVTIMSAAHDGGSMLSA